MNVQLLRCTIEGDQLKLCLIEHPNQPDMVNCLTMLVTRKVFRKTSFYKLHRAL